MVLYAPVGLVLLVVLLRIGLVMALVFQRLSRLVMALGVWLEKQRPLILRELVIRRLLWLINLNIGF